MNPRDDTLLPTGATPVEHAIETVSRRIDAIPLPLRWIRTPSRCPAALLPWLAWELSVDRWRDDWTEATKRAVIAASPHVHRTKGSVAAVRAAVQAVVGSAGVAIIEWFRPGGSGRPYTATVEVDVTAGAPARLPNDVIDAVASSKPLRTRVDVRLLARPTADLKSAALIRRPIVTARLTLSSDLRPNISTGMATVALIRRPLTIATLRGAHA